MIDFLLALLRDRRAFVRLAAPEQGLACPANLVETFGNRLRVVRSNRGKMRTDHVLVAAVCLLLGASLAGCTATVTTDQPGFDPSAGSGSTGAPNQPADLSGLPASCHVRDNALPDPACTPGATDPAVTQANIGSTICVAGYTTRVRPPVSYTTPLKRTLMARYGETGPGAGYELDHLVPLEIGGAPRSVSNLWPEPNGHPGSTEKDHLENYLHTRVCAGRLPLADAQRMFETNWLQSWEQVGRP